ncbi:MAG: hypothetical protein BWY65_02289 [Firmicutes bacterium ADurb.Bin373]|jgi:hypothetical protein|nr:MAG: hypothetical protein BWY65_02289 [Firmicutes bacterium ADurb.Bin373]
MYYVVDAETGEIVQYLTRPLPPARPRKRPGRLARAWGWVVLRWMGGDRF